VKLFTTSVADWTGQNVPFGVLMYYRWQTNCCTGVMWSAADTRPSRCCTWSMMTSLPVSRRRAVARRSVRAVCGETGTSPPGESRGVTWSRDVTARWSEGFVVRAEHDGTYINCSVVVPPLPVPVASRTAVLTVRCKRCWRHVGLASFCWSNSCSTVRRHVTPMTSRW